MRSDWCNDKVCLYSFWIYQHFDGVISGIVKSQFLDEMHAPAVKCPPAASNATDLSNSRLHVVAMDVPPSRILALASILISTG